MVRNITCLDVWFPVVALPRLNHDDRTMEPGKKYICILLKIKINVFQNLIHIGVAYLYINKVHTMWRNYELLPPQEDAEPSCGGIMNYTTT